MKFDRDEMEFSHPYFQRDHPYLLEHIKRKISTAKTTGTDDKANIKHEIVSKVLQDVKLMKGRQDSLDNRFLSMKQENEALWREVAILRQKHLKQQQIVNKLIQFLVTIVQPQRNSGISSMGGMGGMKRRYQLMINDIPDGAKVRKTSSRAGQNANGGPVIRELTEELLDNYTDADDEPNSPYVVSPGGFAASTPSINDYEEIENIENIENIDDVDTNLTDDADVETATITNAAGANGDNVANVYNTADYNSDLIYDMNTNKISNARYNVGACGQESDNVDDIRVEELLDNVTTAVSDELSEFIKTEQKSKQPILIQAQPNVKQSINKTIAHKKLPGLHFGLFLL